MQSRGVLSIAMLLFASATLMVASAPAQGGVVESANGSAHWTIPLPNPFDIVVRNRTLSFNAHRFSDGTVSGHFEYHQVAEGESFNFNVRVTCMHIYDGHRAKIGGVVEVSNDPTIPPGRFAWFQVFDNGEGAGAQRISRAWWGSGTKPRTRPSAMVPTCRASVPGTSRATSRFAPGQ